MVTFRPHRLQQPQQPQQHNDDNDVVNDEKTVNGIVKKEKLSNDYYSRGSTELATQTKLTLERLEARRTLTKNNERLVLVLVGLPARGKSFLARKLTGFLKWHGVQCKVFNVGKYRRKIETGTSAANFFDSKNTQAAALREKAAEMALMDMLEWLDQEGNYSDDDDDDDGDDDSACLDQDEGAKRITSSMNPECLKSERYTRNDAAFLNGTDTHQTTLERVMPVQTSSSESTLRTSRQILKQERIAIFDATNSTNKRRQWVLEMCTSPEKRPEDKPTGCVFIESICDDEELLMENFKEKIANSPDYSGMSQEEAIKDLKLRVQKYEEQYETIMDDKLSYIKIFNLSSKIMANQIYGRMSKIIMPAMMAWNIGTRPIFLCRPGQTLDNITTDGEDYVARVEDDPQYNVLEMSRNSQRTFLRGYHLGASGRQFSQALLEFVRKEGMEFRDKRASIMDMKPTGTSKTGLKAAPTAEAAKKMPGWLLSSSSSSAAEKEGAWSSSKQNSHGDGAAFPLQVFTSTMPRATQTVDWDLSFDLDVTEESNLNPLDKGDLAGKELDEIRKIHPVFYQKLAKDGFHTRFPGGESYCDLIKRLDAVIVDLEQQVTPTLVVSHVSVLQMLVAYFRNSPVEKCMDIDIPLHTVIKFTPARGGGWSESIHPLSPTTSSPSDSNNINGNRNGIVQQQTNKAIYPKKETASKKHGLFWPFSMFGGGSGGGGDSSSEPANDGQTGSPPSVLDERKHRGLPAATSPPALGNAR